MNDYFIFNCNGKYCVFQLSKHAFSFVMDFDDFASACRKIHRMQEDDFILRFKGGY